MGLAGSKGLLDSISEAYTPVSCKSHSILAADPRSPSEEFPRTPIAIDDDEYCIATSLPQMSDPRSPTVGFERTPIPCQDLKMVIQDPRSPTTEVPRTPLEKLIYDYQDDSEQDDDKEAYVLEPVPIKQTKRHSTPNFAIAEDSPAETPTHTKRFVNKPAKINEEDSPRSPLAISNRPNSLRIRVQHKQHATKVATMIASSKQPLRQFSLVESIDKENSPVH